MKTQNEYRYDTQRSSIISEKKTRFFFPVPRTVFCLREYGVVKVSSRFCPQLFHFDVHEDVRTIADATIEKDEVGGKNPTLLSPKPSALGSG